MTAAGKTGRPEPEAGVCNERCREISERLDHGHDRPSTRGTRTEKGAPVRVEPEPRGFSVSVALGYPRLGFPSGAPRHPEVPYEDATSTER